MLAEEYGNMQAGTQSVLATSENIHSAKDRYGEYTDRIKRSKGLVDEIQKAERLDELKLRYSFNFFVGTAVYLLLKRFFLWEIIYAVFYIATITASYSLDFIITPLLSGSTQLAA